jgi:CDP-glucose 4,6-dehydratase
LPGVFAANLALASMATLRSAFAGKRVFITGHTGFKGSWLSEWLLGLGAEVWGYSLPPPTQPALFEQLKLAGRLRHEIGDVRDQAALARTVRACGPHFVFHLAAQPIVRAAYTQPVETWTTNVFGTISLLEALRALSEPCAAIVVTTDKVYAPSTQRRSHPEEDPLGGRDPYSASKAAAEIATAAYRSSFFSLEKIAAGSAPPVAIATARAGNVIGGGDWAPDRLIPDCVRALSAKASIDIRYPDAVRPWQHVLEPLGGYLLLAASLGSALQDKDQGRLSELCSAFNFGPALGDHKAVRVLVEELLGRWPGEWRDQREPNAPLEAEFLSLDITKAGRVLGWQPRWDFAETIERTVAWYRGAVSDREADELTRRHRLPGQE